jgi:hypothetical protein
MLGVKLCYVMLCCVVRLYPPYPAQMFYNKYPALNPPGGCGGINLLGDVHNRSVKISVELER